MTQVSGTHGHGALHVRSTNQIFKIGGEKWGGPGRPCSDGLGGWLVYILVLGTIISYT